MPTNDPSQLPPRPCQTRKGQGGGRGQGQQVSTRVASALCPALFLRIQARKEDTRYIEGRTEEVAFAGSEPERWYLLAPALEPGLARAVRTNFVGPFFVVLGGK